jgi:hypothetical protein
MNNEMLAVTGRGLKSADFKDGFYSWDNENLDAPHFTPSGSHWVADTGNNVVMPRHEMFWL